MAEQGHVTGHGLRLPLKDQKAKGILPAGSAELGSSTNVFKDVLELAWLGVAGNALCIQLTNLV